MANKGAPLFKKAFKGYNKEDVNSYILSLNNTFEENKLTYEKAIREYNMRAEDDYRRICELTNELSEADELKR